VLRIVVAIAVATTTVATIIAEPRTVTAIAVTIVFVLLVAGELPTDHLMMLPGIPPIHVELHVHSQLHARALMTFPSLRNLQAVAVPDGESVESLVRKYQQSGLVEFAEPDYVIHEAAAPNDPRFQDGSLWPLNNYGQNSGTPHADIGATNAWDVLTSASNIVVAVVDSGILSTHEDLAANMRVNPNGGLKYVWIPSGTFMMGCSPGDTDCFDGERVARR